MKKDKKYYLGIALFVYSFLPYVFTFLVLPFLPISKVKAVSLATGLLISSEVAFLLSVALLGKPFVQLIKTKIKASIFRKKGASDLKPVGKDSAYHWHCDAAFCFHCALFSDGNRAPSRLCGKTWSQRFDRSFDTRRCDVHCRLFCPWRGILGEVQQAFPVARKDGKRKLKLWLEILNTIMKTAKHLESAYATSAPEYSTFPFSYCHWC